MLAKEDLLRLNSEKLSQDGSSDISRRCEECLALISEEKPSAEAKNQWPPAAKEQNLISEMDSKSGVQNRTVFEIT